MADKLVPCPFCGGDAKLRKSDFGFYVICEDCMVVTQTYSTDDDAISTWNKRSNWLTGEPTEEGWYLVAYECVHECSNKGKLEYHTMHILADEYGCKDIRGRASDEVWKAVAWMPIEPYKED